MDAFLENPLFISQRLLLHSKLKQSSTSIITICLVLFFLSKSSSKGICEIWKGLTFIGSENYYLIRMVSFEHVRQGNCSCDDLCLPIPPHPFFSTPASCLLLESQTTGVHSVIKNIKNHHQGSSSKPAPILTLFLIFINWNSPGSNNRRMN